MFKYLAVRFMNTETDDTPLDKEQLVVASIHQNYFHAQTSAQRFWRETGQSLNNKMDTINFFVMQVDKDISCKPGDVLSRNLAVNDIPH